jgi:hypothetical protein
MAQKWEYVHVSTGVELVDVKGKKDLVVIVQVGAEKKFGTSLPIVLDDLGEQGWELVAANPVQTNVGTQWAYDLKRPKA